jgi:hypothetical protein
MAGGLVDNPQEMKLTAMLCELRRLRPRFGAAWRGLARFGAVAGKKEAFSWGEC